MAVAELMDNSEAAIAFKAAPNRANAMVKSVTAFFIISSFESNGISWL